MSTRRPTVAALGHLASAMVHEARNPLNSIAIHAELLETRLRKLGVDVEPLLKSVAVITRDVERIDGVLREYLRFVAPRELVRRDVAVAELVAGAIDRAEARARSQQVTLRREPATGEAIPWRIDAAAIGQALDAILSNALEATSAGGAITVRWSTSDGMGRVEVSDTGEGFAPEAAEVLFRIGHTTRAGHTGLGLAVAKQIVKIHGGAIRASSTGSGQGATFRIDLPIAGFDED